MIKKGQRQSGQPVINETTQLQRQAVPGPSADVTAAAVKKQDEKEDQKGARGEAPNLLAGLTNLDTLEEEQDQQIAKLKKFKDQITLEGNVRVHITMQGPREVLCTKYNEEFDYIAGGYSDGVIRVYKSNTGEHIFTLGDKEVDNVGAPCTSIKHRQISKLYPITNCYTATYANGCVKCWSYHFNQCLYTIREKRQTYGLAYHPRFPKFVTYGDDLKIHLYDEETRTQERILTSSNYPDKHDGHTSRVFAGVFHPKNNYELITGGWDDTIQFWDLRQPYAVRHIAGCHLCGEGLDIHPRGTEILVASFQLTDALQLFDYGSGRRIARLEPDIHPSKLYCGKFINKDFVMCGGAEPHIVRIIDLQSTTNAGLITAISGGVYSIDIGPARKKYDKDKKDYFSDDVQIRMKTDLTVLPRVVFLSSKKIYQLEFF